jgi:hypothetical protein
MMIKQSRWVITSLLFFMSSSVSAYSCYEPSAAFEALGEEGYYEAEPIEVDENEPSLAFLKALKGDWKGTLKEKDCFGSDANPRVKQKTADVEVEILENNSAFFSAKLKKDYDNGTSANEKLDLLVHGAMYGLSVQQTTLEANERQRRFFIPAALAAILNDPSKSAAQKQQARNKLQTGRFVEIVTEITQIDDILNIEWSMFSNGVYVYTQTLSLERD